MKIFRLPDISTRASCLWQQCGVVSTKRTGHLGRQSRNSVRAPFVLGLLAVVGRGQAGMATIRDNVGHIVVSNSLCGASESFSAGERVIERSPGRDATYGEQILASEVRGTLPGQLSKWPVLSLIVAIAPNSLAYNIARLHTRRVACNTNQPETYSRRQLR